MTTAFSLVEGRVLLVILAHMRCTYVASYVFQFHLSVCLTRDHELRTRLLGCSTITNQNVFYAFKGDRSEWIRLYNDPGSGDCSEQLHCQKVVNDADVSRHLKGCYITQTLFLFICFPCTLNYPKANY